MGKPVPVVRVPGFTRDELRLIDRAAKAKGWSRAQWLRYTAVEGAKAATLVREPAAVAPLPERSGGVSGHSTGDLDRRDRYDIHPGSIGSNPTHTSRGEPLPLIRRPSDVAQAVARIKTRSSPLDGLPVRSDD